MSRPCKSAALLTECSQTKAEVAFRNRMEKALSGNAGNLSPPDWLNDNQQYIFMSITNGLSEAGILGELDIYLLTQCSIAIDRLQEIEKMLNDAKFMLGTKEGNALIKAKDSYTRDFFRCCNELSLSPQSRAKIANINLQKAQTQADPLLAVLAGDVSEQKATDEH